jgi:hypothetical protein
MKKCFVISPIGPEGSQIREHADDVYDYIIRPAMEECGIQAFRSDHLHEPGKISEQMFREILTDDLSIAVLTGHNPNVFYELAIAHAAGRPVVILIEKGESLPFDIHEHRCVHYDLKPRSLFDKVYVREVVDHVRTLERCGWKVASSIGNLYAAAGQPPEDMFSFFTESQFFGNADTWLQLLRDTEKTFEILGIHLGPWKGGKGFTDTILRKADAGCQVRILLMHPGNPILPQMINDHIPEVNYEDVVREIEEMTKFYSRLAEKNPAIRVRQARQGVLHCQTTRTDQYGVYIPYLYSRRRRHCPLWQCKAGSPLYGVIGEEFESLWRANESPA